MEERGKGSVNTANSLTRGSGILGTTGVVDTGVPREQVLVPLVAFIPQDVAVFRRAVAVLPLALEAAFAKFFDCCACDTKYFDL
jgi:hypothetical protein